jgi:hypothetical protein
VGLREPCSNKCGKARAKVVIVEKGAVIRASGGSGVDHWHLACSNQLQNGYAGRIKEAVKELNLIHHGYGNA